MTINRPLSVFALVLAVLLWPQAHAQSLSATIEQPSDGARVAGQVEVRGTLSGTLPANTQLWIVVKQGDLMWPKDPPVDVIGQNWSKTVDLGGRGRYALVLMLVGKAGQEQITSWIQHGMATHSFPGLARIKGVVLAQVPVERQ